MTTWRLPYSPREDPVPVAWQKLANPVTHPLGQLVDCLVTIER
jgi:hypothetical protein